MLLSLAKNSQQYESFVSNFHQNFATANQTFGLNYQPIQQHTQSPYQYIQPSVRAASHQNVPGLNIRTRRRRTNHSLVATMDPSAVARRNERERNRVKQVNDGFNELRKKIPYIPEKKKFSKVEILRFAMLYIRELQVLINDTSYDETKSERSACTSDFPEDDSSLSDFQ